MSRLTSWARASDRRARARARRRGAEDLMGFILNRRADGAIPSVVSRPAEVITPSPGGGRQGARAPGRDRDRPRVVERAKLRGRRDDTIPPGETSGPHPSTSFLAGPPAKGESMASIPPD